MTQLTLNARAHLLDRTGQNHRDPIHTALRLIDIPINNMSTVGLQVLAMAGEQDLPGGLKSTCRLIQTTSPVCSTLTNSCSCSKAFMAMR